MSRSNAGGAAQGRPGDETTLSDMARRLGSKVTKLELLEAAWHLASLSNDADSLDDDEATFRKLVEEINVHRERRQMPRIALAAPSGKIDGGEEKEGHDG